MKQVFDFSEQNEDYFSINVEWPSRQESWGTIISSITLSIGDIVKVKTKSCYKIYVVLDKYNAMGAVTFPTRRYRARLKLMGEECV